MKHTNLCYKRLLPIEYLIVLTKIASKITKHGDDVENNFLENIYENGYI